METVFRMTNSESRLASLIWDNQPVASMKLVRLAQRDFDWKRSTTFTILKFLIEKGLAKNEKSSVTMLYTRDEVLAEQSCQYVDNTFGGSLPMFITAFTSSRKLTSEQIADLKRLIDEHEGERAVGVGNG